MLHPAIGPYAMARRIEANDGWIDLSQNVADAVTERAISENERFGDALVAYLDENLGAPETDDDDDDNDDDDNDDE